VTPDPSWLSGDSSTRWDCGTASTPGRWRHCAGRQTWCFLDNASPCSSTVASGTAVLTTHRQPSANADYWIAKVEGNRRRDAATDATLAEAGWTTLRFWAHENPEGIADVIRKAVVKARDAHG
jgi:hypothetical protein